DPNAAQEPAAGPAVARLIQIDLDAVRGEIEDVGCSGSIRVGQLDTLLVEQIRRVEPRRTIHGHLAAEMSVAEVRPITDLAVADPHNVRQSVTGHVSQIDRLRAVGEDDSRPILLVMRSWDTHGGTKSLLQE